MEPPAPVFRYIGDSAETYAFELVDGADPKKWPDHGGIVVLAQHAPAPVWIGAVDSVRKFLHSSPELHNAKEGYDATLVYVNPATDDDSRDQIVADLIERYTPPMNPPINKG